MCSDRQARWSEYFAVIYQPLTDQIHHVPPVKNTFTAHLHGGKAARHDSMRKFLDVNRVSMRTRCGTVERENSCAVERIMALLIDAFSGGRFFWGPVTITETSRFVLIGRQHDFTRREQYTRELVRRREAAFLRGFLVLHAAGLSQLTCT